MNEQYVRRARGFAVVLFCMFAVLTSRLWYLQVVRGADFSEVAEVQRTRTLPIRAPRGEIYARGGQVLAGNRFAYTVSMVPGSLFSEETRRARPLLARLLGISEEEIEQRLTGARQTHPYEPVRIVRDVGAATVVAIEEHRAALPGVVVEQEWAREYPFGVLAGATIGYLGEADRAALSRGYRPGDLLGQTGLEHGYEAYLRGRDGQRQVEVNVVNLPVRDLDRTDPIPGHDVYTTLDIELQTAAEHALREHLAEMRRTEYPDAHAGAVVALDPRTGEILVLATYPTYDPGRIVANDADYWNALVRDERRPFLHRGLQAYPPGSTFKAITGLAAMASGAVGPDEYYFANGYYRLGNRVYRDWSVQQDPPTHPAGMVNIVGALARSSNDWFWEMAMRPALYGNGQGEVVADWARRLGLGRRYGVGIPGESEGIVPDAAWKLANRGEGWLPGDSLNVAIGQGDLQVTPLQMAVAYMTIANRGVAYKPHLVSEIRDPDGRVVFRQEPEAFDPVETDPVHWQRLLDGLRAGVDPNVRGLAHIQFRGAFYNPGGKTGSAQVGGKEAHAWFAAIAPIHAPEIVVVAFAEHGGSGAATAAPIVRRVLDAYFSRQETITPPPPDRPIPRRPPAAEAG